MFGYEGVPPQQQVRFIATRIKLKALRGYCRLRRRHNWHEVFGRVTWTDAEGFQERSGTGTQCQTCATMDRPSVVVENIYPIDTLTVDGSGCVVRNVVASYRKTTPLRSWEIEQ